MSLHSIIRASILAAPLFVAAAANAQDEDEPAAVFETPVASSDVERARRLKDHRFRATSDTTRFYDGGALEELAGTPSPSGRFAAPAQDAVVDIDHQQIIIVVFPVDSDAVDPAAVSFSTTFGNLSGEDRDLAGDGSAIMYIESSAPGDARIKATTNDGNSIEVDIKFRDIDESVSEFEINDQPVALDVFDDRFGIQATTNATRADIAGLANDLGLEVTRVFYRGLYEFKLAEPYTVNSIRNLGELVEINYPNFVKNAGVIVEVAGDSIPLLAAHSVIAVFTRIPTDEELDDFVDTFSLVDMGETDSVEGCDTIFVFSLMPLDRRTSLAVAEEVNAATSSLVEYAQPNFVEPMTNNGPDSHSSVPINPDVPGITDLDLPFDFCPAQSGPDPRLCQQWHHNNAGTGDATVDADLDTAEAWRLSTGSNNSPLIAVIDSGFSNSHPDYVANLWTENGVIGRDYADDDPSSLLDNEDDPSEHGTSVAGIVGSVADNTHGGRGVCPGCRMMLLRHDGDNESTTRAICFAKSRGAVAINNSWGATYAFSTTQTAIEYATDADISVVFAMETKQAIDNCIPPVTFDLSVLPNVIGVSRVTNQDIRTPSGYGTCMDVLGPSRRVESYGIGTTRVYEDNGIKNGYTVNFGGTSAAAPMVTGTIGLLLDVNPGLSRIELQRVLQDTADRVDPDCAAYDKNSGFSNPSTSMYPDCGDYAAATDMSFTDEPTHGYGRINAFEAVSLVAPFDPAESDPGLRGHAGKDLLLRDNYLDWGNTEQASSIMFALPRRPISVRNSVDIKIDVDPADVGLLPEEFAAFETEPYAAGERANVYVRLRNRGPETIDGAVLKLYWTMAPDSLPPLPVSFWDQFPDEPANAPDPESWNALERQDLTTIRYSGASVAGCPGRNLPECHPLDDPPSDDAQIVTFQLPALEMSGNQQLSLLAIAHSDEDPVAAKVVASGTFDFSNVLAVVENDNNVALWIERQGCSAWLVKVIAVLIVIAIVVGIIIVWRWIRGRPVPTIIYVVMTVTVLILIYVYIKHPACFALAVDMFAMK